MWSANKRLAASWPGTGYVDWAGPDRYLPTPGSAHANTVAPDERRIKALAGKPIPLAETAAGARPGNEPGKIRDLLGGVRRGHLLGLVWFDVRQDGKPARQDGPLEDNPAALAALKADVAS